MKPGRTGGAANARLLGRVPDVYIGPEARSALAGDRGLLLGSKRADAVDVLLFECCAGVDAVELLERRWGQAASWDVVGVGLPAADVRSCRGRILEVLAPGDVVVATRKSGPKLYVHDGETLAPARFRVSRA